MMDSKIKNWKNNRNILKLLQYREINSESARFLKHHCQFTDNLIKRLGLEFELEGHSGCVNCLQWSADGRHLASGSDDTNVIYWDPFHHKKIHVIPTPHIGNIFSIKFLGSNDSIIATAAGDCKVIVQNVEEAVHKGKGPPLLQCSCHVGRVKRLATCPDQPMIFWSAGEDGLVSQYDMREPHECPTQNKIFLDLSFTSEIKCIAVNPTNPNYIAIGANDCFVRLYDRRKVKLGSVTAPQDPNCVQYYSPGHLAKKNTDIMCFKFAATYLAFNSTGTEMLVNMGGEQIYLFDVHNSRHINEIIVPQNLPQRRSNIYKPCCSSEECLNLNGVNKDVLVFNKDFCACDYLKRASQLLQRNWMGDTYAAARDYLLVLQHCKDNKLAYIGLIKCLIALEWTEEATAWLKYFIKAHPEHKHSQETSGLDCAIKHLDVSENSTDQVNDLSKRVEPSEKLLIKNCFDYESRFLGHCNTTTDIKEVNFLGEEGNYICAGSDEGIIFIWDKKTTEIVTALLGDVSIVNCIQPHPSACFIASSGIDPVVKLWSPTKEDGKKNLRVVGNLPTVIEENQQRMAMDPFESMFSNMVYRFPSNTVGPSVNEVPTCRTS